MLTDCREKKWRLRKRFLTSFKDWVAQHEKKSYAYGDA